ncbi:MAG: glycosyltransferase [Vicingaceae bacterium]
MSYKKKIVVSVSSDLSTDQRVQKVCDTLVRNNFEVLLLGRKLSKSTRFSSNDYAAKRFKLWFNKGALFYANLNICLFFTLLFTKLDVLYANDLDTLLANYLVSKIKGVPIIYDSHEYFTEVPELVKRPSVQRVWERIEGFIVPRLTYCITVTTQISKIYSDKYGVPFKVMRNFPMYAEQQIPEKENFILYQGSLNTGRGLEEKLKSTVKNLALENKVLFLGRLAPAKLREYTLKAKLGVSLEHKLGLNYTFALPNKIFDYLHCETPILYADLIEVKRVLDGVEVGQELKSHAFTLLANQLNEMLVSKNYELWQQNCKKLSVQLNWQKEEKVLTRILQEIG